MLRKIADNVCIKVPLTIDGLKTCKKLTGDGTMVNVTLCFSANQALLAAKAGASFVSPFVGRHDDNGFDGMELIRDIRLIYDNYAFETEILVASVRHGIHVLEAARIGADVMTAPPAVIKGLFKHVLTDKGIEGFLADWAKTGRASSSVYGRRNPPRPLQERAHRRQPRDRAGAGARSQPGPPISRARRAMPCACRCPAAACRAARRWKRAASPIRWR